MMNPVLLARNRVLKSLFRRKSSLIRITNITMSLEIQKIICLLKSQIDFLNPQLPSL